MDVILRWAMKSELMNSRKNDKNSKLNRFSRGHVNRSKTDEAVRQQKKDTWKKKLEGNVSVSQNGSLDTIKFQITAEFRRYSP